MGIFPLCPSVIDIAQYLCWPPLGSWSATETGWQAMLLQWFASLSASGQRRMWTGELWQEARRPKAHKGLQSQVSEVTISGKGEQTDDGRTQKGHLCPWPPFSSVNNWIFFVASTASAHWLRTQLDWEDTGDRASQAEGHRIPSLFFH